MVRTSGALEGCGEGEDPAAGHLPGEEDCRGDDAQAALEPRGNVELDRRLWFL